MAAVGVMHFMFVDWTMWLRKAVTSSRAVFTATLAKMETGVTMG